MASEVRTLSDLKPLDAAGEAALATLPPLISTDSHIQEPADIVGAAMPPRLLRAEFREEDFVAPAVQAPRCRAAQRSASPRLLDQDRDGIQAEVLFPNNGMVLFGLRRLETQQAGVRAVQRLDRRLLQGADPKRLFGARVSVYDIDAGVQARCIAGSDMGLTGAMVWQVPDPRLPFTTDHYERLWAAAAEADAPVHLHILTGHSYNQKRICRARSKRSAVPST